MKKTLRIVPRYLNKFIDTICRLTLDFNAGVTKSIKTVENR